MGKRLLNLGIPKHKIKVWLKWQRRKIWSFALIRRSNKWIKIWMFKIRIRLKQFKWMKLNPKMSEKADLTRLNWIFIKMMILFRWFKRIWSAHSTPENLSLLLLSTLPSFVRNLIQFNPKKNFKQNLHIMRWQKLLIMAIATKLWSNKNRQQLITLVMEGDICQTKRRWSSNNRSSLAPKAVAARSSTEVEESSSSPHMEAILIKNAKSFNLKL